MSEPAQLAQIQFLDWVSSRPRTYAQVQEAWRSSCPRLSIWEDALGAGLVRCEQTPGKPARDCAVTLTRKGRSLLQAHSGAGQNRRPAAAD